MSSIIQAVSNFVREKFEKSPRCEDLTYHNITHIENVVEASRTIAKNSGVSSRQLELILIAAWFHDIGYLNGFEDHEKIGAQTAREFLKTHNYSEADIREVENCIMATEMPQNPQAEMEKIICDADLSHLASDNYFERAEALRREIVLRHEVNIDQQEWMKNNANFIEEHRYFTEYAKKEMTPKKEKNYQKVLSKIQDS